MEYYTERHRHTCGVDLHGRNLYLCVLDPDREIVLHRRVDCDEEKLLRALAPYRDDLVIEVLDVVIKRLERVIVKAARGHDHNAFALLKSVHGIGDVIGLTLLYEIHDIRRFDSLGGFLSYCRLIKCDKTSDGKKKGTGGRRQDNHHLKWAFSEAAALFLRANPEGQKLHSRLRKKHCKAKALGILAAKLARSVYCMLHRNTPFDMNLFVRT